MLRSVYLRGPAGRLEALLNTGVSHAPSSAALLCHPHPGGGGTMHNKVVYSAMKALNEPRFGLGWPVLRFNFRGTGASSGVHDGAAETGDVLAALHWLHGELGLPVVVAGFSFGAAMALDACCGGEPEPAVRPRALIALGLPILVKGGGRDGVEGGVEVRRYSYSSLSSCSLPKLFLSGDRDQYAPVRDLQCVAATTAEPKKLVLLPGADHFFAGQLDRMQHTIVDWLKEPLHDPRQRYSA